MWCVCVCVHCKLSWGPSLGPSVKSGSIPLCWAVRVMQWQAHDKYREGGEAKAYESEAALHIAFKTSVRHIQRMWCIYPACCLCGRTEQQANQMCYLYGVKPRLCMEYVRNLSLTLNFTLMLSCSTWQLLVVWFRGIQRTSEGGKGRTNPEDNTIIRGKYEALKDNSLSNSWGP